MNPKRPTAATLVLLLAGGCAAAGTSDVDLAAGDLPRGGADPGKADLPGWDAAATLHFGEPRFDRAAEHGRQVHALWAAGRPDAPIPLEVTVEGLDDRAVRVAVLGPLVDGAREVLAAGGYGAPTTTVSLAADLTSSGQHLVVIGSHGLATDVTYHVAARCVPPAPIGSGDDPVNACPAGRLDLFARPKVGALVGSTELAGLVRADLGEVLADRDFDLEMEVSASRPMQWWNGEPVAVGVASGSQVNVLLPAGQVAVGDDLRLVARTAGGRVLDTGVLTRYAPEPAVFARLDAILYGDLVSVDVSGVTGYFEGTADLALRSEDAGVEIDRVTVRAELPGQVGNGLAGFDASFAPELDGPALPHDGELLSVGRILGDESYARIGCFEYCNDLAGLGTCTGGPRACPATD